MKRRFGLYGFGFAIGIVLVIFFLGGKEASCNWMPNDRMLKIIRSKSISYSEDFRIALRNSSIDSTDIDQILVTGDIDFSKSQVKNNPCRNYFIEGEVEKQEVTITVKLCDSIATIETLNIK